MYNRKRVLQVGINQNDRVAGGVVEASRGCDLMPEVPRQVDYLDPVVGASPFDQQFNRRIPAPVVHEYNFSLAGYFFHEGFDGGAQQRNRFFLVVHRDDKG